MHLFFNPESESLQKRKSRRLSKKTNMCLLELISVAKSWQSTQLRQRRLSSIVQSTVNVKSPNWNTLQNPQPDKFELIFKQNGSAFHGTMRHTLVGVKRCSGGWFVEAGTLQPPITSSTKFCSNILLYRAKSSSLWSNFVHLQLQSWQWTGAASSFINISTQTSFWDAGRKRWLCR